MSVSKDWWCGATIYQVYPRSYKDANGDGVGDLKGITQKIPYIASLNVDAVWISPFMKSPMKDFGYDVSDYCDVDPLFGSINDFKELLAEAHKHNIKIIMDMILSHTSDQHPWFQESRKDRTNPKADWYVWANPNEDGTWPNNWISVFGGSSWAYDSWRGQYYLHNFLKEQPDLNVQNPEVQEELLKSLKFWLDLGVDGFRLDAINFAMHDKQLRNNPARGEGAFTAQLDFVDPYSMQWHKYDKSQPEMLDFLKRIRDLLDQYDDRMALGEIGDDDEVGRAIEYSGGDARLHTCYNFSLVGATPKSASKFREAIEAFENRAGVAWPSWAFSNHDTIRAASRWAGKHQTDERVAKLLPALLTSLRGTAFIYQGEELGLPETEVAFDDIQDPYGRYLYPKWAGRDGCRTPMPWNSYTADLGFSDKQAAPWLPVNQNFGPLSAERQEKDPKSTLSFVKSFLKWRKGERAMVRGPIKFFDTGSQDVLGFTRTDGDKTYTCLFNLTEEAVTVTLPNGAGNGPVFVWEELTGNVVNDNVSLPGFGFFIS